jgi:hypothetical protein
MQSSSPLVSCPVLFNACKTSPVLALGMAEDGSGFG